MSNSKNDALRFFGAQSIREASGIHEKILECFRHNDLIVLEFADIAEVDLTFVQLIESARISAAREGKTLRLSAPASGELLRVLERGGFLGEQADPRTQFWLAA